MNCFLLTYESAHSPSTIIGVFSSLEKAKLAQEHINIRSSNLDWIQIFRLPIDVAFCSNFFWNDDTDIDDYIVWTRDKDVDSTAS